MTHYRTNKQKLQLVVMVLALPATTLAFTTPPAQSTIKNQIHIANQNLHTSNTSPSFFLPAVPVPAPARRIKSSFATTSDNDHEIIDQPFKHNHGLHPLLNKAWGTICTSITKQDPKAFTLLAATVIMASTVFTPQEALAARSGGRMGGSFGESARLSRSYSSPSRGSIGSHYMYRSLGYGAGMSGVQQVNVKLSQKSVGQKFFSTIFNTLAMKGTQS